MCAPRLPDGLSVSWQAVRLARRKEGACRRHVTDAATPPGGRIARKPGNNREVGSVYNNSDGGCATAAVADHRDRVMASRPVTNMDKQDHCDIRALDMREARRPR